MRPSADGPQLEHGYTRIANELLEAVLRYPFTGGELKLVLAIVRLTYGWGQKERVLSVTELAHVAALSDRHAKRLLQRLAHDHVITKRPITRMRVRIGVNKYFSTWRLRRIPSDAAVPSTHTEVSP